MGKCNKYIQIPANILLFIAIAFFAVALLGNRVDGEAYIGEFGTWSFNENWILKGEHEQKEIVLPAAHLGVEDKTIIIENILPSYVDDGMRLCMRSSVQDIYFYIDGELRGSYAAENLKHVDNYPPSSYVMVDLKKEDAGKQICIEVAIKKKHKLNEIRIGYGNNVWFSLLKNNLPVTVAAIILASMGILAVIFHFSMRKVIKTGNAVFFLGETMIIVGLWIISESYIRQLIFQSPSYSSIFAYLLVELIGGFVAMYFNEIQKYHYNKAYIIIETLVFGQAALNTVLALTGVMEFNATLWLSHIWMLIGVAVASITVFMDIKTKRIRSYSITSIGMLIFIVFCLFEFVGYYFADFYRLGVYLCIGFVVLLITTITQTLIEEFERTKQRAKQEMFQSELEKKVAEQTVELNELFIQTVTALSEAVDAKDRYTSGHSKRVAEYSRMIAARMGKSKEEQEEIFRAGLLHDVGKIRVPVDIINKAGKLTDEEYNTIKLHPVTGYHILRGISGNSDIAIAAKYHHERYDGKGYPNGLIGNVIPEVARILGVADSYDAMTSNRSYRKALPQDVVREEIVKGKGTQFDPDIADIMLQMIDEDTEYTMKQNDCLSRRILIVDDEPMNHKLLGHILKDEPMYELVSAVGGREALQILEKQEFDLIMLDVMMPQLDGLETLKLIREKYQTPIVLMTGVKTLDASTEFTELGCEDYITKPFAPLLVKEVVYNITKK